MAEPSENRVAVYIDFDNIVISRYDQVFKRGDFVKDRPAMQGGERSRDSEKFTQRSAEAKVNVDAILDFAASFGTIAISRAYADWSATVNASYRRQLVDRAIDLVQLFPVTTSMKNGADIRLSVDVIEDLFHVADITHVVLVAGDSDYIALAQRSKRLGRFVIGIGVAGATSQALTAACDRFFSYEDLPGIADEVPDDVADDVAVPVVEEPTKAVRAPATAKTRSGATKEQEEKPTEESSQMSNPAASKLLIRALNVGQSSDNADDSGWLPTAFVKLQMKRMDARFNERSLGFKNFTEFVNSRGNIAEMDKASQNQRMRLRPGFTPRTAAE